MWLPTSDDLVLKMLDAAKVGPQDELVDLGAGDGKIPIAAARQFGARAWGIEYNKDLAALAQRNAQRAGVCLLYTSPSPRDRQKARMPSSA